MSTSRRKTEMAMRLRTLLGDHPGTSALKKGAIKSDLVEFEFVDYSPTNKGFKPMVREQAFDVSEMAIVTYLMAKSFGKPMVLLPNVVVARFQQAYALYNAKQGRLDARRPQRQARRHPLLHHHDRRLAARHPGQRPWRRSQFGRLGDLRGCPCRRVQGHHQASAGRQADRADADRWRARCGAGRKGRIIPT